MHQEVLDSRLPPILNVSTSSNHSFFNEEKEHPELKEECDFQAFYYK